MADDIDAKRNCAAYADTINRLRATTDLPETEIERRALDAVDQAVYGHDCATRKDRNGNYTQNGVGSKGHESVNHFASIRRWHGQAAYDAAVREIFKRDPGRAQKLGLTPPARI